MVERKNASGKQVTWTKKELAEFDRLTLMSSSPVQMERVTARIWLPKFIEEHGKAKCDAMFKELTK